MKRRLIWILNHHANGLGRHHNFAKSLVQLGHHATIFASSFAHNSYKETRVYPDGHVHLEERSEGYNRVYIKTPPYYNNGIMRLINQLVFAFRVYRFGKRKQTVEPDVIIGSSVHLFTGLAAYYIAKKKRVPFIFEVRDLWPQTLIDLGALKENSIPTKIFRWIEKFLYRKADKIISVLPHGYRYMEQIGIHREKVVHIPNGVDLKWYDNFVSDELDESLLRFFDDNKGQLIVTYAGAFGVANGLDTIIHAAQKLQDMDNDRVHFLLVGEGPEKNRLVELANNYQLQNVTFHKGISKNQIPRLLSESDVCLSIVRRSPVHKYGISMNKIFDYLASEKPMISALEASFDFAEVAQCGIAIPPDDPEQLVTAILHMSNMSVQERERLGTNGREYVLKHHDFPVLTQQLLDTIEEVLNGDR